MRAALVLAVAAVVAGCVSAPMVGSVAAPSQVPPEIEAQLLQIGRVIDPPQTEAIYAPLQQKEPYAGVRVARGERYGPDPERNLLDVFTPEAASGSARPVLVFVHGGGFIGGSRRRGTSPFYDNVALWAVRNGMIGVNTTYRLAPQHPWPAAQEDLAATIAWVQKNIAARGGDPSRIYVLGHSSGATHVAEYIANPRFHVQPAGGIAGAILVSGLYDPSTARPDPVLQSYFGTDRTVYAQRSALRGMAASRVPMLLAYAELDPPEFQAQAQQGQAALCAAAHCGPLLQLLGHSHMSEVYAINTVDTSLTDVMRAFIRP